MSSDENVPISAGLSSFNLLDEGKLFTGLDLEPGMSLLDFGCGLGNYSIAASPYVGNSGHVYAVDPWEEGIETLEIRAAMTELENIQAFVYEAGDPLPIKDQVIDLCLMATVVHILGQEQLIPEVLLEITRVLKPEGTIAVVEFHKKEGPPGPPLSWRLAPDELTKIFGASGFQVSLTENVGPHNYLSLFSQSLL